MPNPLIKSVAKQAGVKKSKVEHVWNNLKKEYGTNYKAITGTLEKIFDVKIGDTNREITPFNHLKVENCLITRESVDGYKGSELKGVSGLDPDRIYMVLRPLSEIKKAIDSYNDVPLVNEHYFVDGNSLSDDALNKDKWLGCIGSKATIKDGGLYNSVAVWDGKGINLINQIKKKGLSAGYKFNIIDKKGSWNGKPYDFEMSDIVCNHVALVNKGRVEGAEVADQDVFNIKARREDMSDNQKILAKLLQKNPQLVADAAAEVEKEEKEEMKDKKGKDSKCMKDKKGKDKKGRDNESDYDDPDDAEDSDDDEPEKEEKQESMKDKRRAKDKRARDNEESEKEEKENKASDAAIAELAQRAVIAYNSTRELCERVIGKTAFAADALPEQMVDSTLKAKGCLDKYKHLDIDGKKALLQFMGDTAITTKQPVHVIATDSGSDNSISVIEI